MKNTSLTLGVDTANKLRLFKIKAKVKNLDEVIQLLIKSYREYQKMLKEQEGYSTGMINQMN